MIRLSRAVPVLLLCLAASACGVSASRNAGTEPRSSPTPAPTHASTPGGETARADLGTPVATRTAQRDGFTLVLTVYPLTRDGAVATLNLTLKASGDSPSSTRFQLASLLADGNDDVGNDGADSADGIRLIDGAHGKVYLVASDGEGQCLCSRGLSGSLLDDGETTTLNATFAAPPTGLDSATLSFPTFGTVPDVPVV